ncbi:M23 family metallopeptidase [Rhizomonospora bruguierae]|uniref:M23 family metallopeptidase n=1 Tax=Rhizomonospora bruguierae TaxID=1581705 RepID=UPI0035E466F8
MLFHGEPAPSPRQRAAAPIAGILAAAGALALLAGCGTAGGQATGAEPAWVAGGTSAPASTPAGEPSTDAPTTAPPTPTTKPAASAARYVFPVGGKPASYHHTHSGYKATDIFAGCGKPVLATTDGIVLEVSREDTYSKSGPQGPDNGGLSVSLLGDDGVRYYGSHLSKIVAGVNAGVRVRAGQHIGAVGRTGNANNVCHLHYGISPPCARTGDWWIRRGVIWPYPYLDSWYAGGNKSPVAETTRYKKTTGCPKAPAT